MKYIAHRGLISGPDSSKENHPDIITASLNLGYDCEIDLRVQGSVLALGHDRADYQVGHEFICRLGLWIHCKNYEALEYCQHYDNLNYFWHENDAYTITSQGWGWAYPGQRVNSKTIQVMPELADATLSNIDYTGLGVCSDWILRIQRQRPNSL